MKTTCCEKCRLDGQDAKGLPNWKCNNHMCYCHWEKANSMKIEELEKRVSKLEYAVFQKELEECPRCHQRGMNHLQKDVCSLCAYTKEN